MTLDPVLAKTTPGSFETVVTITPTASVDNDAAAKVLDDFKSGAARIRLGLSWKSGADWKHTNKVTAVAFTAPVPDPAPKDDVAPKDDAGANAMTTFAIGFTAAAALF